MLFDSGSASKGSAIRVSVNSDSISEILGYFHQQLSKHENDLSRMQSQVTKISHISKSSPMDDVQIFLDTSNARLETFAASIHSLSQQLIHIEKSYKREIELNAEKIYAHIENRFAEVNRRLDELEQRQIPEPSEKVNIDELIESKLSELKSSPDGKTGKKGKRAKKQLPVIRKSQPSQSIQCELQQPSQDVSQFQNSLAQLRRSCMEIKTGQTNEIEKLRSELNLTAERFRGTDEQIIDELNALHGRIDDCVTKAELSCFLSSYKDERRNVVPLNTAKPQQVKRVHITTINGDNLRRPRQPQQTRKFKASSS